MVLKRVVPRNLSHNVNVLNIVVNKNLVQTGDLFVVDCFGAHIDLGFHSLSHAFLSSNYSNLDVIRRNVQVGICALADKVEIVYCFCRDGQVAPIERALEAKFKVTTHYKVAGILFLLVAITSVTVQAVGVNDQSVTSYAGFM